MYKFFASMIVFESSEDPIVHFEKILHKSNRKIARN